MIPRRTLELILKSEERLPFRTARGVILDMTHYFNSIKYLETAFKNAVAKSRIEAYAPPSLHDLRDAANTYALKSRPSVSRDAVEFAMGHTIDPLGYNQCWRDETWMWEELSKVNSSLDAKGL